MSTPAILVVEDDEAIASGLVRVLDGQGYAVQRGRAALSSLGEDDGLVVLDLGLPDMDGLDVCRALRAARPDLAILILTARDQELDVVAGLDAGADDYLVKPFRLSELLARVRANLRRAGAAPARDEAEALHAGDLTVDLAARRAWRGENERGSRPLPCRGDGRCRASRISRSTGPETRAAAPGASTCSRAADASSSSHPDARDCAPCES